MTILYINPLPKEITMTVLEKNGTIISETKKIKNTDEFSFFPELLVDTANNHTIQEIWCVCWPWAFTLMRIITLAINSIWYARNIRLKSCNFFELANHPDTIPIIEANAREYLIQEKNQMIALEKGELPPWTYQGIFTKIDFEEGKTFIEYTDTYSDIISVFEKKEPEIRLTPIYFKPPNITCSTKTM